MIAIPIAGQSIGSAAGDTWLVDSVTRKLAHTVVNLVPLHASDPSSIARRLEMSLSDFRIFCIFSNVRMSQPDSATVDALTALQLTAVPALAGAD